MLEIRKSDGPTVEAVVSGKLTQRDYQLLVQEIDKRLHQQQDVRMLMELQDFTGWSAGGVWEEYKFDATRGTAVDRLAMVGARMVNEIDGAFDHPFMVNEVKYFHPDYVDEARAWLHSAREGDGIGAKAQTQPTSQ